MKLDLLRSKVRKDFGTEAYVQLLNIKFKQYYWSLIQISVSWNDDPSWPFLQTTFGCNGFFSSLFWVYKFGLGVDVCCRSWADYFKDNKSIVTLDETNL